MRHALGVVLAVLLVASAADARPRHWYTDWRWWAGEGAIATALILDGHSSCRGYGYGYSEGIPLARGSTSCGATAGRLAGGFVFYTVSNAAEWHFGHDDPNRAIRAVTPWVIPAIAGAIHGQAAAHNYSLPEVKLDGSHRP